MAMPCSDLQQFQLLLSMTSKEASCTLKCGWGRRAGKDIMALYMEEGALKNIPLLSGLSRKFRNRREARASRDSGTDLSHP